MIGGQIKRIAYFDIETSDLKADFGIVLTWCSKNLEKRNTFILEL